MNQIDKRYYFMAGLPRSGSTLLSAILNQNPDVHSGPSSPVTSLMVTLEQQLIHDELYLAYPKPYQAAQIVSSVLPQYYSDVQQPIIIDKNRSWTNRPHFISGYFNIEPKIICPVRTVADILTSFITLRHKNPFQTNGKVNFIDEMLIKSNLPITDEQRCRVLAGPNGILGQSYESIKQMLVNGQQKMLHFVEYDDLISDPDGTMRKIYEFLGEEYYKHDFTDLVNTHKENDAEIYGMPGMHDVRSTISKTSASPESVLPESIIELCAGAEIWRDVNIDYTEIDSDSTDNTTSTFIGV